MKISKPIHDTLRKTCFQGAFIFVSLFFSLNSPLLAADEASQADTKTNSKPARGRPDHLLDLSWTGAVDDGRSIARGILDDRILTIGNDLPLRNKLKYSRTSTGAEGVPPHLYEFSESVVAQNDDWIFVGKIGSSSDKLFHDSDSFEAIALGGTRIFNRGPHSLYGMVLVSRENYLHLKYNIPIPLLFYGFRNDSVTAAVGIPILLFLKISPTLTFNFIYLPIFDMESGLKYRPLPFISFGPEFIWKADRYFITRPLPDNHRYYHEYIQLLFKIQSYITAHAGAYIAGGCSFIDRYYDGERSYDRNHTVSERPSVIVNIGFQLFL